MDAVKVVDWDKVHRSSQADWGPKGPDWDTWNESYGTLSCIYNYLVISLIFRLEPDAGIVNFYQEKDTLMAHVDRSEVCATSPLVSIS